MSGIIETKCGNKVQLKDVNFFNEFQISHLKRQAKTKTMQEWLDIKNRNSAKIKLTNQQIGNVLNTKHYITYGLSASAIYNRNLIFFTEHCQQRIMEYIERRDPKTNTPKLASLMKVIELFKNSDELSNLAGWKGYPELSYNFIGNIDNSKYYLTTSFKKTIYFVTIIDEKKPFKIGESARVMKVKKDKGI